MDGNQVIALPAGPGAQRGDLGPAPGGTPVADVHDQPEQDPRAGRRPRAAVQRRDRGVRAASARRSTAAGGGCRSGGRLAVALDRRRRRGWGCPLTSRSMMAGRSTTPGASRSSRKAAGSSRSMRSASATARRLPCPARSEPPPWPAEKLAAIAPQVTRYHEVEARLVEPTLGLGMTDGTRVEARVQIRGSTRSLGDPVPLRFLEVLGGATTESRSRKRSAGPGARDRQPNKPIDGPGLGQPLVASPLRARDRRQRRRLRRDGATAHPPRVARLPGRPVRRVGLVDQGDAPPAGHLAGLPDEQCSDPRRRRQGPAQRSCSTAGNLAGSTPSRSATRSWPSPADSTRPCSARASRPT